MTHATRTYFEALAPLWDSRMPPDLDEALRRMLAPYVPALGRARRILEIGTGTGALIAPLRAAAPAARLLSVDLAHAMLSTARQRGGEVWVAQVDAQHLPLASAWDVVVCHNSFPHFRDKPRALAEIRRVLRPGGTLLVLHNHPRARVNAIHTQAGAPIDGDLLPPGAVLRELMVVAGFADISVDDTDQHYAASAQRPSAGTGDDREASA